MRRTSPSETRLAPGTPSVWRVGFPTVPSENRHPRSGDASLLGTTSATPPCTSAPTAPTTHQEEHDPREDLWALVSGIAAVVGAVATARALIH